MSKKTRDIENYISGLSKTNATDKIVKKTNKKSEMIAKDRSIIKSVLKQNEIVKYFGGKAHLNQKLVANAIMSYMKNRTNRNAEYNSIMIR